MKDDFANAFADFLEERLGKALFALRENNEEYRKLSDEHAALLNGEYHSAQEYNEAIMKIAEVYCKTADIEKRYLFLAGMREHARVEDALSCDEFEKLFTDIN